MNSRGASRDSLSYSKLFNLESLINFRLPQRDDDFDFSGNSSEDESRCSQGGAVANHGNGAMSKRKLSSSKRKRKSYNSDEEGENYAGPQITEERYRSMLGEHLQKYHRRHKDSTVNHVSSQMRIPTPDSCLNSSRIRKLGNENRAGLYEIEPAPDLLNNVSPQRLGNHYEADILLKTVSESSYLDIGESVKYKIPPTYDKLAASLNLPSFSDIGVEEIYLKGTLDLGSVKTMMASDRRLGTGSRGGIGEPWPQYESLQARLKALAVSESAQKFSLKVSKSALDSSIPKGAAGNIQRFIMSEDGHLQVYYVKVLEKGDTYEIIERCLSQKPDLKKEPSAIEREEMDKIAKVWVSLVRKDIPKHHRIFTIFHRKQLIDAKRFSENCQREVRAKMTRSHKFMKGASIRTRKLARDMLLFWKRVDKEMAEIRKKEEKEAAEALRREQELREAKRQQQRLNFLIQQTELYSHFMQKKTNSQAMEAVKPSDEEAPLSYLDAESGEEEGSEEAELKEEALKAAQDAVSKQKKLTSAFDDECLKLRQAAELDGSSYDASFAGSGNIDLHNPSTMPVTSTVQTPGMFKGSLKDYQLKGLQWLVNCYEQGLNGILADEMGLGKTIQAMAFLAHLAEEKNIWGPFLVIAPSSVLNNWVDEVGRFCPDLKTLPYWGGIQERTILRKNINPKRLYRREAGFHILVTSYQLLVSDEKYLRRVKWQYMVLDEAQAIKSSSSIRWKTLLSFNCRNRLLLTGTPVQNNMAELWALLHFIMPTLFDSHDQFNEWFSKGIENHAEHGGTLNEHQLNRLHAILKPFMLRRVKKDAISELTKKTEITVHCQLSSRQKAFYQAIKNKISLADLFDNNHGRLDEKKVMNLMNIVIQLRKVCNHPELFERNEGSTYLHFGSIGNSLLPPPFGELEDIHYSGGHNPIMQKIPKLLHQEVFRDSETLCSATTHGVYEELFYKCFNIFSPENVFCYSLMQDKSSDNSPFRSGTFGFTRLIDLSAAEVAFLATASFMERLLFSILRRDRQLLDGVLDSVVEVMDDDPNCNHIDSGTVRAVTRMLLMPLKTEANLHRTRFARGIGHAPFEALVISHRDRLLANAKLLHSTYTFIPQTRAPPIIAQSSDRNFAYKMAEELHNPCLKRLLVGFARTSDYNGPRKPDHPHHLIQEFDSEVPVVQPALQLTYEIFGSSPPMQSFDPAKTLTDSGKLQTLDILLKRLRAENHRVLLFAQMTKMLNILEDYMNYRKYRYLRLDGSSTIMDRRDMVRDFQSRSDIFVFLLSTRAGGVGINLTAADTVIFYENDWNPTLDLQAMDRAHRLGQTKDVTVYRLICKETVEEKILQRANQKNTVQQLVMTGGHVQGDLMAPEDVFSLLLDDAQLEQKLKEIPLQGQDKQKKQRPMKGIRIDDEGDARFEDFTTNVAQAPESEPSPEPDKVKSSNRKRKDVSDKQTAVKPKTSRAIGKTMDHVMDESRSEQPKRPKRLKKKESN